MQAFLSKHADTLALSAGVMLALAVIAAYVLGITDLATDLNATLDPNATSIPAPTYDLEAAGALDLKGLSPAR